MLLARNAGARAVLQRTFEARAVQKYYLALIGREIAEDSGEIDISLGKHRVPRPAAAGRRPLRLT
ncbi:MAG: hypothetical protein H0V46_08865 [Sphingomonas sp.]|nr:hypothetical protein [Sphingomonas sp.]